MSNTNLNRDKELLSIGFQIILVFNKTPAKMKVSFKWVQTKTETKTNNYS